MLEKVMYCTVATEHWTIWFFSLL